MRTIILGLLLSLPGLAGAWEPIDPANPTGHHVTTTTIVDMVSVSQAASDRGESYPVGGGDALAFIAFADADVGAVCRAMAGVPANEADPSRRSAGTYGGRYVVLPAEHVPLALFARAHGMRVRVKIRFQRFNGGNQDQCLVFWFQTCADPNGCPNLVP